MIILDLMPNRSIKKLLGNALTLTHTHVHNTSRDTKDQIAPKNQNFNPTAPPVLHGRGQDYKPILVAINMDMTVKHSVPCDCTEELAKPASLGQIKHIRASLLVYN